MLSAKWWPFCLHLNECVEYIDGLVQERSNSIGNALELRLFCIKPLIWQKHIVCYDAHIVSISMDVLNILW